MVLAIDDVDGRAAGGHERIGQIVDETYRLTRYIGCGGSSHVFEAEHIRLGKRFAVKLLRQEVTSRRQRTDWRFRREARAIARVDNQHVVSVIDCGELADDTPYLVMELLEGEDLRSLLSRHGTLPMQRALRIVLEACRGLTSVHAAGLIHRDLKPENLFIARKAGGEDWCKILDFGVAKMPASLATAEGAIVGTVRYMAPEQLEANATVGPATDVYALGAIMYECLSGRALHEGESVQQLMYRIVNQEPTPLRELCPQLPRPLVDVVDDCIAKRIEQRPASAADLCRRLEIAAFDGQVPTDNATLPESVVTKPSRRNSSRRRGTWWVPCALSCALGFALGALVSGQRAPRGSASAHSRTPTPEPSRPIAHVETSPPPRAEPVPSRESPAVPSTLRSAFVRPPFVSDSRAVSSSSAAPLATPRPGVAVGSLDYVNPYVQ